MLASDTPAAVPPTWILVAALIVFASLGGTSLALGRYWARRHREGRGPGPKTFWSGSWTVPHHPQDGIFFGWFYLSLALVVLGGLAARLLGLW